MKPSDFRFTHIPQMNEKQIEAFRNFETKQLAFNAASAIFHKFVVAGLQPCSFFLFYFYDKQPRKFYIDSDCFNRMKIAPEKITESLDCVVIPPENLNFT